MVLSRPKTFTAFAAILVAAASLALLFGSADRAGASSVCKTVTAKVGKHTVEAGDWLRVSGRTCDSRAFRPRTVRIKLRAGQGWRTVGTARTRANGRYTKKVKIDLPAGKSATHLRAMAAAAKSRLIRLRLAGNRSVNLPGPALPNSPIDPVNRDCALSRPGSEIGLQLNGCSVVVSDTGAADNPMDFWGRIDCGTWPTYNPSRHKQLNSGGDFHATANGVDQSDSAFRRLTVIDGDEIAGERCELGLNDHDQGPTALFREGQRRATFVSLRLPENFPLGVYAWQTVLQMKQAQPSAAGGGSPILEMQAFDGRWIVASDHGIHWEFPASKGQWTRFMFDVTYSRFADRGSLQVAADLNADGDVDDEGERSPRIQDATLKTETAGGGDDGIAPGQSIPSHLRAGIYHNTSIDCPPPVGCSTEVDNVQVLAP